MKSQISQIKIQPAGFRLEHPSNILTLGSCFSNSIGERLKRLKFNVNINPFGTLFNPLSIVKNVQDALTQSYSEEHLIHHDGLWKSLDLHSELCHPSKMEFLSRLETIQQDFAHRLKSAEAVFITLGSAVVHRYLKTDKIIANNHKLAANEFRQELLKIEAIREALESLFQTLKKINPKIQIVLSLSPVRHLQKGVVLNQRSKARLLESIHSLVNDDIHYFPAYELVLDELRDYRYYKEDLVHPNGQAIDRVWDGLSDFCFSAETKYLLPEIEQILKMQEHIPQHHEALSSIRFEEIQQQKIDSLLGVHPHLNFDKTPRKS